MRILGGVAVLSIRLKIPWVITHYSYNFKRLDLNIYSRSCAVPCLLWHRFTFHQAHWGLNSNWKLLNFKKCKEEPVGASSSKRATKWGVAGECVQSHHNQALMCGDSGEITRSYPSFITLQIDTPTLSLLFYSLYRYFFPDLFFSPFDTFLFCHSCFSIHLYRSITVSLMSFYGFVFVPPLPWSLIWHVMPFKCVLFIHIYKTDIWISKRYLKSTGCPIHHCHATRPSVFL